ncbi:MAG: phosphotransferase, partial [Chloroflexi bacterium]|nr:phosphotransferase [Chloroflexota bacterium]
MAPAGLRLIQDRWNTIYRVDTMSGERYALRLGRPGKRTILDIQSELAWLQALQDQSDVMVPRPVANRDGGLVTTVRSDGPAEPCHCVLFTRVPGRTARNQPTERNAWRLGRAMALLHDHADTFRPPADFSRLRLDSVWTFGHPDLIYSDAPHPLLTAPRRALLRAAAGRVQGALDEL